MKHRLEMGQVYDKWVNVHFAFVSLVQSSSLTQILTQTGDKKKLSKC